MKPIEVQLATLSRRLWLTQIVCGVLFASLVILTVRHRDPPPSSVVTGGAYVTPREIGYAQNFLNYEGLSLSSPYHEERGSVLVQANDGGAFVEVGTTDHAITTAVTENSSISHVTATGRTTLELQFDTEAGTVSLVRDRDPRLHRVPQERLQLFPVKP